MTVRIDLPFDQWLRCHASREDAIGAFARASSNDPLLPSSANCREYIDHFEGTGVLSWVSEAFDDAWEEYSDLRFDTTAYITRSGDDSWSVMFSHDHDFIMESDQALEDARDRVSSALAKISGADLPCKYAFTPGETFPFPEVGEVTSDYRDLMVDIEVTEKTTGVDLEIARAICDLLTESTGICALFQEDDVLTTQRLNGEAGEAEAA